MNFMPKNFIRTETNVAIYYKQQHPDFPFPRDQIRLEGGGGGGFQR